MIKNMSKWAAVCAAMLFAPSAHAVTSQNFVIDTANSSVSLSAAGSGIACNFTRCGISASLANGFGGSFALATGQSNTFNFLQFNGQGSGGVAYDVSATLAFLTPAGATTTGNGNGAAALFRGRIIGGVLNWTNLPASVILANGSQVGINFQGGLSVLNGRNVTTTATVSGINIVPVPMAGLLLLTGVGLLGAVGRRKARAA